MEIEKNLLLPTGLAEALLRYLAERPYRESAQLIQAIQQLAACPSDLETVGPTLTKTNSN